MDKITREGRRQTDAWAGPSRMRAIKHKKRDLEDMPKREKTSNYEKSPGFRFGPIFRWLEKQVGRKWLDVQTEITATIKDAKIKSVVMNRVDVGVEVRDTNTAHSYGLYYVSDGGLLQAYKHTSRHPKRELPKDEKWIDATSFLGWQDGQWYYFTIKPCDGPVEVWSHLLQRKGLERPSHYCLFNNVNVSQGYNPVKFYASYVPRSSFLRKGIQYYADTKRQASKKELKKAGLR